MAPNQGGVVKRVIHTSMKGHNEGTKSAGYQNCMRHGSGTGGAGEERLRHGGKIQWMQQDSS